MGKLATLVPVFLLIESRGATESRLQLPFERRYAGVDVVLRDAEAPGLQRLQAHILPAIDRALNVHHLTREPQVEYIHVPRFVAFRFRHDDARAHLQDAILQSVSMELG